MRKFCFALALCLCFLSVRAYAQTATVTGEVADSQGKVIRNAEVRIASQTQGTIRTLHTNDSGIYNAPFLDPGPYRIYVQAPSFSTGASDLIVLTVGQTLVFNFQLKVGNASESVTVEGGGQVINTTDGSVSTIIDSKFVENTPLNGRSFQSLILLTPGTVTNTPQRSSAIGASGEFSVNGQRTESNYYTVDGVSANGAASNSIAYAGPTGSLPAATALGTTQALVSVDALQEFRVESSTYSAEYGRAPGGQFSMITRSGTTEWHGTAFDYFRNDALDANNWFNDNTTPKTRKTAERQNDFGGTFGGPIHAPYLFSGTNRSFFFFSYEGLRLLQPTAATINAVPDVALRQSAAGALQQALNAYPIPTPGAPDLGNGFGEFIGSWSSPSQLDATSIRFDEDLWQRLHLFFRFSNTPSSGESRGTSAAYSTPSESTISSFIARTYTFGATAHIAHAIDNDLRINHSSNDDNATVTLDNFGGAVPVNLFGVQGFPNGTGAVIIALYGGGYEPELEQAKSGGSQRQWNVVNNVSVEKGTHSLKFGIDWRSLSPTVLSASPESFYEYTNVASVAANNPYLAEGVSKSSYYPTYKNFSAFAQDNWKVVPRVSLSMGIRWEVNPAPGASRGLMPYTVLGLSNPATMTLAPQGTPLWKTTWYNFAPRLGVAYQITDAPGRELILRGGGGVFFDTGQQTGSYGFQGPGFQAQTIFGSVYGKPTSFPAPVAMVTPSIITPPIGPYTYIYANPEHLQLPYTFQWNISLEQALGKSQSLSLSYVGSNGRKLLEEQFANISAINPTFDYLYEIKNGLSSSYNSLQVKYQKQVLHGLQALASYTWSHAIDFGSYNALFPYERGNSDQDVRHNLSAGLSYDLPLANDSGWAHTLTSGWGVDGRLTARSGFPVTLNGNEVTDPSTLTTYFGGLNIVPNVPFYISGNTSLGKERINPSAFALPAAGQYGDAPRNFLTGFGAVQTDVAIRRSFPIFEHAHGQFRAEAFNVFNHPIFGLINSNYGNAQFGMATATLSQSLGTLSPLYQMGGPRSLQITLRVIF